MSILVDTGILAAAAVKRDAYHERARAILQNLEPSAFFTDHILVETWLLLNRRYGRFHAMRFWMALRDSPIAMEIVVPIDIERAQAIAQLWPDQDFDIVDCTSFAVMERVGCSRAATFDSDFAIFRYGSDRTKAFEILR